MLVWLRATPLVLLPLPLPPLPLPFVLLQLASLVGVLSVAAPPSARDSAVCTLDIANGGTKVCVCERTDPIPPLASPRPAGNDDDNEAVAVAGAGLVVWTGSRAASSPAPICDTCPSTSESDPPGYASSVMSTSPATSPPAAVREMGR